jgi:hypothetical protein
MGNGPNVINQTNVGSVSVSVTWPAGSPGTEIAQVTLGGTITVPVAQSSGAGTTTVSGIDASSLADGPVSVTVAVADPSGNPGTFVGAMAVKSAAGPISASSVNVPGSGSNPPNWVNLATAGAVTVQVTFPPSAVGNETVALSCTDGSTTVNAGTQPVPAGGGTVNFAGLNLSGLVDGPLSLTATTTDAMANMAATGSSGVAKDTVPPANPTAAQVPAGVSNPVDMINSLTVLASNVNVTWPGDAGNETMYVVVTDGVSSQASLPQTLAAGPALVGFGGIDCTPLADGPVTLSVNVTDAAGNPAVFTGTPATKDTVGPSSPTSAHVIPTAGNPIDTITTMNVAATGVSVAFGASGSGSDSATVTLSDGSIGVSSGAQSVVPNGSVTYTLNATALADGPVSVSVNVFDPAGNVTVFSGTPATKSTGAPMPATSAIVVAGPNNPLGAITLLSAASVAVDTTVPSQGSGMTVTCSLTDGSATVSAPGQAAPPAGGTVSFTGMDCSGLSDGPITINVTITDALNNMAPFGSSAVKDTVGPPLLVDPTTSPTSAASQLVTGQSDPSTPITILGGFATAVGSTVANGRFALSVPLNAGATNALTVSASDAYGNTSVLTVDYVSVPLTIVQNPAAPPVVFTDVTGASGLSDANGAAGGSFQDLDNDGDLDLFVGVTNKVWQNNGFGVFTDVTSSTATPFTAASSAVFGDYDNDGYVDLLLVGAGSVQLMHNESKNAGTIKFTDATTVSLATASGAMKAGFWADLDQDGFLDFVVTDSDPSGPEVRRNLGNGTYAPLSLFAPASTQMFFGVAADIVADNRPDFIFADASPSFFHRNDGLMAFTDIAGATSNVSIGQIGEAGGVIVADYDNDGDLDVIVAAGGALSPSASCGGCLRANNQLFHNNGTSSFTAQIGGQPLALLAGIEPSDGWEDLCAGDVNNDGKVDLMAISKGATRLFLNQGDLTGADGVWEFLEVSAACGVVSSGVNEHMVQMADIDGDGDLDLFVPNSAGLGTVYRNDVNNRRNLTVLVRGLGTGPGTASVDGIGAHVELRDSTGATILASREISGGRGFGSQDSLRAHFGVTPSQIYTVQVTFPSGAVRTSSNVVPRDAVNQTITVNE